VPVTRFWLPAPVLFAGMAQKAYHRNRNEELPLSRQAVRPARRRVAVNAGGDRGKNRHGTPSRKSAAPREGRGAAGLAYADSDNARLSLTGHPAKFAYLDWAQRGSLAGTHTRIRGNAAAGPAASRSGELAPPPAHGAAPPGGLGSLRSRQPNWSLCLLPCSQQST